MPSVDAFLRDPILASLLEQSGRAELLVAVRSVLDDARAAMLSAPGDAAPASAALIERVAARVAQRGVTGLRRVLNATGIVLHTGLGRAPLADEALRAMQDVAGGYSNLELDLPSGERGDRHVHIAELLRELTGAQDALVVNNNAAATFLALHSLVRGREAIVSRGQLVEIGGSYRMPDIMAAAGCRLREVGTTNRTHLRDYERAITPETGALLHVHTSNYRIQGFTSAPGVAELVALARGSPSSSAAAPLLVLDDLGSGLLDQPEVWGAAGATEWDEPTVRESVAAGADLTFFSGDKLLGGPQAGILIGRAEIVARLRADPLMRTFRPDKLTLAALEATLRLYRDPARLIERVPTLRMLLRPIGEIRASAERLDQALRPGPCGADVAVADDRSFAGGGSLPTLALPTAVVRLRCAAIDVDELSRRLRCGTPAVVARISADALVLDCRTISDAEIAEVAQAVGAALRSG